ncbi:3-phosphoshikimate 1-carboxyvinyltransferase [Bacillus oleivorans]|uniref:3-phosphoshikimate 1-carboxyvinyltransferase n=1 Tax=Bacillus oleivorans TaxID=1448271 RepID=A0A285CKS3_9BACI|nr:3-phosphoshikimate 1-carboxyvinyltransferase [Bacillus oleivorans]SNX68149.1 3-phosphoshikimate 1-carboxyvinyltransferase [Bacillus oleivorans]
MATQTLHFKNRTIKGVIEVPGDKSISHRSIMFGAIANGKTRVRNFLRGQDCLSTWDCFQKLGVSITDQNQYLLIEGKGLDGLKEPTHILDVGNSGTTSRLLLGILAGRPFHSVLIGDESIAKRPMSRVTAPLRLMGAKIDGRMNGEYTPISIRGGELSSIQYQIPVASAQVKSSLLFAAMQASGVTELVEKGDTRDHTERMIQYFGGKLDKNGLTIRIEGSAELEGRDLVVPGDISSAAFFIAAAILSPNSELLIKNVGLNETRTGMITVLEKMGANIEIIPHSTDSFEPYGDILVRSSKLQGVEIGGDVIPKLIDEIPIIALLATQAEGRTTIKNAEELKVKETNRIDTVANELNKLGCQITPTNDGLLIDGVSKLSGGIVNSHGDHRIGMMLAIASLISEKSVHVQGTDAIDVSFPNFFQQLTSIMH